MVVKYSKIKSEYVLNRILSILLLIICSSVSAQSKLDSLYGVWQDKTQADSTRTKAYKDYIWNGFLYSNPDTAIVLAQALLSYGEQHKYPKAKSMAYNLMGVYNRNKADYPKALEYYQRSLKIYQKIGDKKGNAHVIGNIGEIYQKHSDYPKALEYFQRSLKIREEIGDKRGIAFAMSNIGNIYQVQANYFKAVEYCKKALRISENIGILKEEKYACQCLFDTYKVMGKGNEALVYLEKIQVIDDSLHRQETNKKLQQMELSKQVFTDSIATVEKERLMEEVHQEEVRKKNQTKNIAFGGGAFVLLLAAGLYSRLRFVRKSKASLQVEKDRSEDLLLNILPKEIAQELKLKGKAEARDFDLVSILFTDFKGFTEASAKMSASLLVGEINACFEAFDGIIEKYKVEKIKTIGDSYMAAGGLPIPTEDSVRNTVLAALDMQAFITKRKSENEAQNKPAFEMRVGIHTGSVVAGIVGVKKFQYDIWGDTVNTASRMETNGEVGKVNISQSTYEIIKNEPEFSCVSRGKIEAKGKGEINMYFVGERV